MRRRACPKNERVIHMTIVRKISAVLLAVVTLFSVFGLSAFAAQEAEATNLELFVVGNDVFLRWDAPFSDADAVSYTVSYTKDGEYIPVDLSNVESAKLFYSIPNVEPGSYSFKVIARGPKVALEAAELKGIVKQLSSFALIITDIFSSLATNYPSIAPFIFKIYAPIASIFGF